MIIVKKDSRRDRDKHTANRHGIIGTTLGKSQNSNDTLQNFQSLNPVLYFSANLKENTNYNEELANCGIFHAHWKCYGFFNF